MRPLTASIYLPSLSVVFSMTLSSVLQTLLGLRGVLAMTPPCVHDRGDCGKDEHAAEYHCCTRTVPDNH